VALLALACQGPTLYWTSVDPSVDKRRFDARLDPKKSDGLSHPIFRTRVTAGTAGTPELLLETRHVPLGVAVDERNGRIYWASPQDAQIKWADLAAPVEEKLADGGYAIDLEIDARERRLYWSDQGLHRPSPAIRYVGLDDEQAEVHELWVAPDRDQRNQPLGIALDPRPEQRRIYWVTVSGGLFSLDLEASEEQPTHHFYDKALFSIPRDLELRVEESGDLVFYWPNVGHDSIGWLRLVGGEPEQRGLWKKGLCTNPYALAADAKGGQLYWGCRGPGLDFIRRDGFDAPKGEPGEVLVQRNTGGLVLVFPGLLGLFDPILR